MSFATKLFYLFHKAFAFCNSNNSPIYCEDGLITVHQLTSEEIQSAHEFAFNFVGQDPVYNFRWKLASILWGAKIAKELGGDFIECGTYKGYAASSILGTVHPEANFFLLDTWKGPSFRYRNSSSATYYAKDLYPFVSIKFSRFPNVRLIQGVVPDTLSEISSEKIAFLHLDLNSAEPERRAIEFLWPRLQEGAVIIHDDYGHLGFEEQRVMMDEFSQSVGCPVLNLPTGQGLMIKSGKKL